MDLEIAFLLGLLGSLHCAAMCGPLLLALPAAPGGAGQFIAGRVIYQLGRLVTYGLLGMAAGFVGQSIFFAGLQRWLGDLVIVQQVAVTSADATLQVVVQYVVKSTGAQQSQTFANGGS